MLRVLKFSVVVIFLLDLAGLAPVARTYIEPSFAAVDGDIMYQWHRTDNEAEWEDFTVKYQGRDYCRDCHPDQYDRITESKHALIQCENCHGPAIEHPVNPQKLVIDNRRELCLRCHSYLPYRPAEYAELSTGPIPFKMKDPEEHNPGIECVNCHDVHNAGFKAF
jgi:predicted CXXCH cytochrome family protein